MNYVTGESSFKKRKHDASGTFLTEGRQQIVSEPLVIDSKSNATFNSRPLPLIEKVPKSGFRFGGSGHLKQQNIELSKSSPSQKVLCISTRLPSELMTRAKNDDPTSYNDIAGMDDASALPKNSKNPKVVSKGLPTFREKKMVQKSSQFIAHNVFALMQQKIDLKRSKKGRIYVFEIMKDLPNGTKTGTNIVKIGRTTVDNLEDRMHQVKSCKNFELAIRSKECHTDVYHHQRIEALIHAELANEELTFSCICKQKTKRHKSNCGKLTQHAE